MRPSVSQAERGIIKQMTPEERFTRIEANLQAASEALKLTIEAHTRTEEAMADMSRSITKYAEAASQYVESANTRMQILEKNMDALIRAITSEHGNGKTPGAR
jgi:uncharacterized iron-regulated protein